MRSEASRALSLKVTMPSVDESTTNSTLYRTVNKETHPDESTPQTWRPPSLRKDGISPGLIAKGITNSNYAAEEEEEEEQVEEKSKL